VIVAQRLVRDALKTLRTLRREEGTGPARGTGRVLLRADSAYCGHAVIGAAVETGAEVSVTVRLDKRIEAAISSIADGAWGTMEYPRAVFDEESGTWISSAQVAEVPYTAFTSKEKSEQVTGRLVVRRTPTWAPRRRSGITRSSPPHVSRGAWQGRPPRPRGAL
jgi:hypothetical protein